MAAELDHQKLPPPSSLSENELLKQLDDSDKRAQLKESETEQRTPLEPQKLLPPSSLSENELLKQLDDSDKRAQSEESESEQQTPLEDRQRASFQLSNLPLEGYMQKFRLYETRSNFYMVGRDKSRTHWRVLKIDRLEPSELIIHEDSTTYSERECSELLRRVHDGNRSTGGLKFVTSCYGIIGFVKFLGPYYMLLITKRRQVGAIYGHNIYAVSKCEIIPLPNRSVRSGMVINYRAENRYKKLLCMVDLTKDFFFSYSYHVMRCLQKNICDNQTGQVLYETMFVWNEFLTREIRSILQNTLWTVALVYGFFHQATLSISGREVNLTLIARRSRHYAGTRYLKRGVNENGNVANDVETEQILFEDVQDGIPIHVSSVVQNRGSIPVFWSQETSRLNIKPDIILSKRDQTYEATKLHFENLAKRYGNPIIILNLIKTHEKKPRESILRTEFANAIETINKELAEENHLKFLHWDLHKHSRSKATNVLLLLGRVATYALTLTGFFYSRIEVTSTSDGCLKCPTWESAAASATSSEAHRDTDYESRHVNGLGSSDNKFNGENNLTNDNPFGRPPLLQKGVLRTNCIDCLDRTNVAQYAYGLAALGHQMCAMGLIDSTKIDLDDPLADELMGIYEKMGDTLAHQYGGSAAHNKIFSERRGQWKAATQSQEFFRTLQRYYSNAYMDAEKQNSINVFLGYFQPQPGKPEIWELDAGQSCKMRRNRQSNIEGHLGSLFKRSLSDGNILRESRSPISASNIGKDLSNSDLSDTSEIGRKIHCESTPDISTCEGDLSCSRYTPMPARELFGDIPRDRCMQHESGDAYDFSNFVDLDWLSSSGNSCEEEQLERFTSLPGAGLSSENVISELVAETPSTSESGSSMKGRERMGTEMSLDNIEVPEEFTDSFVHWVTFGEALCH